MCRRPASRSQYARLALTYVLCLAASPAISWADDAVDAKRLAELEKSLSGAALVGQFTDSAQQAGPPHDERYELGEVKHLGKNQWLIQASIRYGEHDVAIPLTLPILWAGDTPVITVDELPVPGLGTFTARVMVYRDHYAGFWAGKDHSGHLFGKIERGKQTTARPSDPIVPGR